MQKYKIFWVAALAIAIALTYRWRVQYTHDTAVRGLCEQQFLERHPMTNTDVSEIQQDAVGAYNLYRAAVEGMAANSEKQRLHLLCIVHGGQRRDSEAQQGMYLYKLVTTYY